MVDYYEILKITPDASQEEIRKAFRKSAKASHPDLFPNDTPTEKEKRQIRFVQLTQAYEILSDHNHRRQYDQRRFRQTSEAFTSKNQNQRTNTSSSFRKKPSHIKRPSRGPDSYQEPEEALRELLRDVDNLLKKFGHGVQDPLEMLINWANNVFINTFKDNYEGIYYIENNSIEELIRGINYFISKIDIFRDKAKKGRTLIKDNFTWDIQAMKLNSLIDRVSYK